MTTRKHPHDGPEQEGQATPLSPVEARLEARIAQQREDASAQRLEKATETEAALAEARDRHLRLAADFDNYKKRSRQEQLETIQHASAELIGRLLPVLDDLRSALEHKPAGVDEAWSKGLELGVRKLEEALSAHGLEPIASVGARFDPKFHEAVAHEESNEHPEDTVVSELRRGYRIRDRVVRPSLVKVSRRPDGPEVRPGADQAASSDR
ncbi:MAG: nucleotide exchange factor GrpE [Chloroflexi bacterium]|nr:MAG: nucleotide exchange factor GrpE [Chloroflexota bacterium]